MTSDPHAPNEPEPSSSFHIKRLTGSVDDQGVVENSSSSCITTWRLTGSLSGWTYHMEFDSHPVDNILMTAKYDDNSTTYDSVFVRDAIIGTLLGATLSGSMDLQILRMPCFVLDLCVETVGPEACLPAIDKLYRRLHRLIGGESALALLWVPHGFPEQILVDAGWILHGESHCYVGMMNDGERMPIHSPTFN